MLAGDRPAVCEGQAASLGESESESESADVVVGSGIVRVEVERISRKKNWSVELLSLSSFSISLCSN